MKLEKEVKLKGIDGKEIIFTLRSILSAYESEQMDSFYVDALALSDDKQLKGKKQKRKYVEERLDKIKSDFLVGYGNKKLEIVVKRSYKKLKFSPDNIKKSLVKREFVKLMAEIDSIIDKSEVSDEKKSPSGKTSSKSSLKKKA